MNKKQLIIYDLDGTLIDTREDIACSANHMLVTLGRKTLPASTIAKFVGKGLHELIKSCLASDDLKEIEKGAKIYRKYYAEHMLDNSRLYPDTKEILEYFKGRKQMVLTNKPNPFSTDLLKALGVADYFIEIVAGDSAYPKKPSPEAILSIMKREGIKPEAAVLIGDSPIDIETARNAGIDTIIVTHGFSDADELKYTSPERLVSDFGELLNVIRKENW